MKAPLVDREVVPSIRKEYHHGFARIFLFFLAIWAALIAILAVFAIWGR